MDSGRGDNMDSPPRTTAMAQILYPRYCDSTNCACTAPNGFGPEGNRVCLTYGPARWDTDDDDDDDTAISSQLPETLPPGAYEMCDFCDTQFPETEMGEHVCPQALNHLREIAREFLVDEAGEYESDSDEDDVESRASTGGTP